MGDNGPSNLYPHYTGATTPSTVSTSPTPTHTQLMTTHITSAELLVRDLGPMIDFYRDIVGLKPDGETLTDPETGSPVLRLTLDPNAKRPARPRAGLFHLALLYPDTGALSAAIRRALDGPSPAHGFQDHGVSEAFYLADPEGNGVELYRDLPESEWPRRGDRVAMGSDAIDLTTWLEEHAPEEAGGVRLGHVHLRTASLEESERFYVADLGMTVTQDDYPGVRFLAWDGYHHHVAVNTWSGAAIAPRQPDETGLLSITVAGVKERGRARDPNNVTIHFTG